MTLAAVVMLLATIPESTAVIISYRGYKRTRYPHFLFMFFTWFFLTIGNLILAISYVTLDQNIYRLGIIASIPLTFAIMVLVDSISRETIDPRKLFVITVCSTALVIFAFDPNSVMIKTSLLGEKHPALMDRFMMAGSSIFLIAGVLWVYYMFKIYLNAPVNIKKFTRLNLLGAIFAGPGSTLVFASGFVWLLPGTDYVLIGIGAAICAYSFNKQPKLGYVLPFKVYRLLAIDIENGLPIYTFTWDQGGLIDSALFSTAFQGISAILSESLSKGSVREISFDQGTLLIQKISHMPVFFVLISSKVTPILKIALNLFSNQFSKEFSNEIIKSTQKTTEFASADKLISQSFPFVVSYP